MAYYLPRDVEYDSHEAAAALWAEKGLQRGPKPLDLKACVAHPLLLGAASLCWMSLLCVVNGLAVRRCCRSARFQLLF